MAPIHPGEILREDVFPAIGKTKVEIASMLGISRQHLHDILSERKPITPVTAVKIGKFLGNGPGLWIRLQVAYDIWHAERDVDVSRVPTIDVESAPQVETTSA